ncbi:MAG: vitamin K epoxide reductase family protein [Nanoarchaeota archaeon]|nr:vitamin K epoxide reductase family protein [Nanoarchaeota archaeon]
MKYKIFLLVFVLSLISSVILFSNSLTGICDPGKGCDVVNNSAYGSTFGVSNSFYGIIIFSFMILLTVFHMKKPSSHTRRIIHAAVILGAAIALYFLYLQLFVIRVFCSFCLIIDFGLLISLIFLFYLWKH